MPCSTNQGCGSVFIFSGSGSGSSILGWTPIRIRIRFRIQHLRMNTNTDPDPDPVRIQKLEKNFSWNFFFLSKTAFYLSLGLHKVCPSYRRSLPLSKEAIQHFKTRTFTSFCLLLWVIFALLDPDPDSEYGSGSGFKDPIEYGSNPDPDPQPCY